MRVALRRDSKTNGIGPDPCFISTEKTWHYVIAAVPVVISDFRHTVIETFLFFFHVDLPAT